MRELYGLTSPLERECLETIVLSCCASPLGECRLPTPRKCTMTAGPLMKPKPGTLGEIEVTASFQGSPSRFGELSACDLRPYPSRTPHAPSPLPSLLPPLRALSRQFAPSSTLSPPFPLRPPPHSLSSNHSTPSIPRTPPSPSIPILP